MCGIAGLWDPERRLSAKEATDLAKKMAVTLAHRGPDDSGNWTDPDGLCALAHRRLSVIDVSSAGRQPFSSHDGRFQISFNGEIYNYKEIHQDLARRDSVFRVRTETDTEILIEAYRAYGKELFDKLDGMYAFALYDSKEKELILARDPFGEKPLYYTEYNGTTAFASELHALFELPFFDTTIEQAAAAEYLCFQYIGGRRTLYKNARKLPPGTFKVLSLDGNDYEKRHFSFNPVKDGADRELKNLSGKPSDLSGELDDLADELEELLLRSIKNRLVADVPLGTFLSGGIDSSLVNALIRKKLDLPVMSFSAGFLDWPGSEHEAAKATANFLGTEHYEKLLTPRASDFLARAAELFDEPNGDTSCLPTYLLSQFAREKVTVAISGDGGDELFGGYDRYSQTLEEATMAQMGELPGWRPGHAYYSNRILYTPLVLIEELFGFVPTGLIEHLSSLRHSIWARKNPQLLNELRKTDIENYLPGAVLAKVDRMSMRHALEVRTPFLCRDIAKFAERLPLQALLHNGVGKRILRHLAARYLPQQIVEAPKRVSVFQWTTGARVRFSTRQRNIWMTVNRICLVSSDTLLFTASWTNSGKWRGPTSTLYGPSQCWKAICKGGPRNCKEEEQRQTTWMAARWRVIQPPPLSLAIA